MIPKFTRGDAYVVIVTVVRVPFESWWGQEASCASLNIPGLWLLLKGFQLTTVLFSSCLIFHHHETPAVRSSSPLASD